MELHRPPADAPLFHHRMTEADKQRSVHEALGIRWYHRVDKPRELARELTASTGTLHFVVALDYGTVYRSADGLVRRAGVLGQNGKVIGSKMFLPFTQPALAAFIDAVRGDPALGPSCLNLYEEANTDRPRRVGFDLELELDGKRKDGTYAHKERAASLWPDDYAAVAASPELFLNRTLVERILPALNALAGTSFTTRDCFLLNSSDAARLSFHVVLPVALPTAAALDHFSLWMVATFASGSSPLSPLLDAGVYSRTRNMRLTLNRKPCKPGAAEDKPWLRPVSRVGALEFAATHDGATPDGPHAFTLDLQKQHMWTTTTDAMSSESVQLEERLRAWRGPPAPAGASGPRRRPPKRAREEASGAPSTSSRPLANYIDDSVAAALTELGFDVGACGGVSETKDELRFRYRALCPLCKADEHGSNFSLWTSDDTVIVKSWSVDHAGDAPAKAARGEQPPVAGGREAPEPQSLYVGDGSHLPLAASFYKERIAQLGSEVQAGTSRPPWRLVPATFSFSTRFHTFLALFDVYEGHGLVHADGCKRMLGVTDSCEVLIGTMKGASRYDWEVVTHRFFDELRDWWQHHPVRQTVPPPPEGSRVYKLPCCLAVACRGRSCSAFTTTGAPWLHLHLLASHKRRLSKVASAQVK